MKYIILFVILISIGSFYLTSTTKADYNARANVHGAISNLTPFMNCLSQKKDKEVGDEKCTFKESDQYRIDSYDTKNVVVHFNFETKNHGTDITKFIKGSIKLSVNNSTTPPTIECKNISLKNKFLPKSCLNNA